jgi:pimeloyl-ACP methyl ester carboxylesterase
MRSDFSRLTFAKFGELRDLTPNGNAHFRGSNCRCISGTEKTEIGAGSGHMANDQNHINFVVRGTDDPTVIFVHGFACSLDDWAEQFRSLSPRFRCVALDLPGHGDSAEPETTSIEIMGSAVNRVKDRIAAPSTILIGHSMGCRVVIDAFQQSGVTVAGLVFVDGSILGCDLQLTMNNTKAAIDRAGMDAFTQQFFSDMFLESGDPELRERLIARAQGLNARFREELFLEVARWDATKLRDALRRISVPTLVLQSTYLDADLKRVALPVGMTNPWMDVVASSVQNSEARVIPNSGHMTMIEAAQAVNNAIQEFAARLA